MRPLKETIRLAVDCLPDPCLVIDPDEHMLYANAAYEQLTGYPSCEIEGRSLSDILEPNGSNADPASALCRARTGFLAMRAAIRPFAGGLDPGLRLVRLEEAEPPAAFVERLGAGLALEGEFLARISHELRTPLTAVQEGLDIVLDGLTGPLNDRQKEFLELSRRNVHRLIRLVNDTLELDGLKRGERPGLRERIDLTRLVSACAQAHGGVQFHSETPRQVWAEIDPRRIQDVLDKLIQNAIRHSSNTAVSVHLRAGALEAVVEVSDSGPGIPEDKLDDIFEEFEQLSVGPGRTVGGVGLGLTIAKLIVEQHGGRIWVESEPGRGARFFFSLMLCSPPAEKFP